MEIGFALFIESEQRAFLYQVSVMLYQNAKSLDNQGFYY